MLRTLIATAVVAAIAAAGSAAAGDPFTGAWRGVDPSDGSTLRLQIGGASPAGDRHVTFTDGFASACGAPATVIGTGAVAGATLRVTGDVRCGGRLLATDVAVAFDLVGDSLVTPDVTFVRPGA